MGKIRDGPRLSPTPSDDDLGAPNRPETCRDGARHVGPSLLRGAARASNATRGRLTVGPLILWALAVLLVGCSLWYPDFFDG